MRTGTPRFSSALVYGLTLAVVGVGPSCSDSPGALTMAEGERCGGRGGVCLSDDDALVCEARVWTHVDCDERCAEAGLPSLGCLLTSEGAECDCDLDAESACGAHSPVCTGWDQLATCIGDTWMFTDCADHCANHEPPLNSIGCESPSRNGGTAACACTYVGTPCGDVNPICDGSYDLAVCEAGEWTLERCELLDCGEKAYGTCNPFADGGAKCECKGF